MGGGGVGGGGGGGDDRRREREIQEREARRERERFERERRRLENERKMRERAEEARRRQERERDDADKRRAEEQARAQREAEERQEREREAREAEIRRQDAARREAEAAEQRKAEAARKLEAERAASDELPPEEVGRMTEADPYAIPGKEAGIRTDAKSTVDYKKRETEALEKAAFVSGDESFVKSESDGSVVRDAQGNPVLTRQGVERQAAFQQEELERLVSGRQGGEGDPEEGKRDLARQIIEEKLEKGVLPGTLGAIQKLNLENQLKNLEKGGIPTFRVGPGGEFTTSGVLQPGEEGTGIAPNITSDLETMMDEPERDEQPTILQAQEDAEDVTVGTLGIAPTPRGRRGTRSKRAGAGGTLLEGGGVLYD